MLRLSRSRPVTGLALGAVAFGGVGFASARPASAHTQTTITCTVAVQNPHESKRAPAHVKVIGTISCTAPVQSLAMTLQLFDGTMMVSQNKNCADQGAASLRCKTEAPCVSGTYVGFAAGTVTFPPGFQPPSWTGTATSNTVSITCS